MNSLWKFVILIIWVSTLLTVIYAKDKDEKEEREKNEKDTKE